MIRYVIKILVFFVISAHFSLLSAAKNQQRFKVASVKFEGNESFKDKQFHRVMITRPSGFLSPVHFYRDVFEEDLKSLKLFFQRNGYLEAEITNQTVSFDSAQYTVDIKITIKEGDLTRIEGISFFGNHFFSEEALLKKIKLKQGNPFKEQLVQDAKLAILTLYADNGFLDAQVELDIRINQENHLAIIDFLINENTRYRIGQIVIQGLEKTKRYVITRELTFEPDEIVQYNKLLKTQRELYMTGLFQSVFIRPQPSRENDSLKKDILVEIKEKKSGEFNISAGYGSVDRFRTRAEVYTTNFLGTARKIGLSTKFSFVYRGMEASYSTPWSFGIPWQTDLNIKYDYQDEPNYEFDRLGGRFAFGHTFFSRSQISLTYRYDKVDFRSIKTVEIPERLKTNIRSLTLSSIYDTRDNMFNTRKGFYLEWSNEVAGAFLKGTNSFLRSIWKIKYFRPINNNTILGSSLRIGWIEIIGESTEIPLNERFYSGGPNSIRGFEYRKVGPLDTTGVPVGGNFEVVFNAIEIRKALYKMIGSAVFLDIGNVWKNENHPRFKDLRISPGIGLRVNTPIGIIRVDYGFNIFREKNEKYGQFYFNMGQAF